MSVKIWTSRGVNYWICIRKPCFNLTSPESLANDVESRHKRVAGCFLFHHEHLDRDKATLGHTNWGKHEAVVRCKDLAEKEVTPEVLSAHWALQTAGLDSLGPLLCNLYAVALKLSSKTASPPLLHTAGTKLFLTLYELQRHFFLCGNESDNFTLSMSPLVTVLRGVGAYLDS